MEKHSIDEIVKDYKEEIGKKSSEHQNIELEIRMGYYREQKFVSEIGLFGYEYLKRVFLSDDLYEKTVDNYTIYRSSSADGKGETIRTITNRETGEKENDKKTNIKNYRINDIRISLSREESTSISVSSGNVVQRLRHSFICDKYRIDLSRDGIKEPNFVYQCELEINDESITKEEFKIILEWFVGVYEKLKIGISIICEYNKYYQQQKNALGGNFDERYPFSLPADKPVSIKREFIPLLKDHVVTVKFDGQTCRMFFDNYAIVLITDNNFWILGSNPIRDLTGTIIIGELLIDSNVFVAFELDWLHNSNMRQQPFIERLKILEQLSQTISQCISSTGSSLNFMVTPTYIGETLNKTITDVVQNYIENYAGMLKNDGLIFTPNISYKNENRNYSIFNSGVNPKEPPNQIYKWKPPSNYTVDLRVSKVTKKAVKTEKIDEAIEVVISATEITPEKKETTESEDKLYNLMYTTKEKEDTVKKQKDKSVPVVVEITQDVQNHEICEFLVIYNQYEGEFEYRFVKKRLDKSKPNFVGTFQSIIEDAMNPISFEYLNYASLFEFDKTQTIEHNVAVMCQYIHVFGNANIFRYITNYLESTELMRLFTMGKDIVKQLSRGNGQYVMAGVNNFVYNFDNVINKKGGEAGRRVSPDMRDVNDNFLQRTNYSQMDTSFGQNYY
jgi:hypothetical protein